MPSFMVRGHLTIPFEYAIIARNPARARELAEKAVHQDHDIGEGTMTINHFAEINPEPIYQEIPDAYLAS